VGSGVGLGAKMCVGFVQGLTSKASQRRNPSLHVPPGWRSSSASAVYSSEKRGTLRASRYVSEAFAESTCTRVGGAHAMRL
jgi:hypothetical protein